MKYIWLLVLLLAGCTPDVRDIEKERYQEAQEIQQKMFYFQDHRTGLCYSYYWGGMANGGPAITLVPREKVEKFLVNP